MASRTGRGPGPSELDTRRTASSRTSRPTVSRLGWACGISRSVGGNSPSISTGGEPGAADLEGGLALAEAHESSSPEHPGQLLQRPGGHQDVLALAQDRGAGQVADGQPVGVGGDEAQPALLGGRGAHR